MKNLLLRGISAVLIFFLTTLVTAGQQTTAADTTACSAPDPANAVYTIEGQLLQLVNGHSETRISPDSATTRKTFIFGSPATGDLDHDGREDTALFLIHDPGGSGTFCYITAALNTGHGYSGTNGVLLGDRISPEKIDISNGVITVTYLDRAIDQAMAEPPNIAKTKYLIITDGKLAEIASLKKN